MKLAVVIDPNLFFVANSKGDYIAHPMLRSWLSSLNNNSSLNQTQLYLLVREPAHPTINIPAFNYKFDLPFNDMFFDLLTNDTLQYIYTAFNGQLKWADVAPETSTGMRLSGQDEVSQNETIVITADAEMAAYFRNKNATVVEMNQSYQPILSSPFDELINEDKVEIYCDFDGTIFDIDSFILLKKSIEISNNELTLEWSNQLNAFSSLQLIHKETISLLKKFSHNKIQLITQREYNEDGRQHPYFSAQSVVAALNKEHGLHIQCHESYFLNANLQIERYQDYTKKILIIYDRLNKMKAEDRPKHILYLDDQMLEISAAEQLKTFFENELDVKLHIALINHPQFFLKEYFDYLEKATPLFFEKIKQLHQQELNKLNDAFHDLKNKQEKEMRKKTVYPFIQNIGFFDGGQAITNRTGNKLGVSEQSAALSCC